MFGTISLTVHDDLAPLETMWRAFEAEADCTVFQSFDWQAVWRKTMGAAVTPAIVIGRERDKLLFILPLAIERGRLGRTLVWHAGDIADYNAPLLAPGFSAAVERERFPAFFAEIGRLLGNDPRFAHDAVCLDKMPESVGTQPNPFMALKTRLNPSGAYATTLTGDWETFYRDKRSSATRRRDRTKRKRLSDIGAVEFVTPDSDADIVATYETLVAQKERQFEAMGVPQLFRRPGLHDFFRDLAITHGTALRTHVSRLTVAGEPVAVNLGFIFRGRYYHIFASYDGASVASRFGPGAAHLHDLMRYAIEQGCSVFDFTIGDEPYKREWSDVEIVLHDHRSAVTLVGVASTALSSAVSKVKRRIKQDPKLWAFTVKARAKVGAWKRKLSGAETAPSQAEAPDED